MDFDTLFLIVIAVVFFWLMFGRGKEERLETTSSVVEPPTNTVSEGVKQQEIFHISKRKTSSQTASSRSSVTSSRQSGYNSDLSSFSDAGDTLWKGSGPVFSFEYVSGKGERTQRTINPRRYFRHSGGTYISGKCMLRNADRSFKISRIGNTVLVRNLKIPKATFLDSLRAHKISSLLSGMSKKQPIGPSEKGLKSSKLSNNSSLRTKRSSKRKNTKSKEIDWRKEGLLSIRGYRVGKTKGLPSKERHAILENLLIRDKLNDVDDTDYAAGWGKPGSQQRHAKLASTLKSLIDLSKKRSAKGKLDLSKAISDWREDLEYLESLKSKLVIK